MRVRLIEAHSSRPRFDRVVLYTNPKARPLPGEVEPANQHWMLPLPFPQPYEAIVPAVSAEHSLEEYCKPGGHALFKQELEAAIQHAVTFFSELYF